VRKRTNPAAGDGGDRQTFHDKSAWTPADTESPAQTQGLDDLAARFAVSTVTIGRWITAGILPAPTVIDGIPRWPADVQPRLDPPPRFHLKRYRGKQTFRLGGLMITTHAMVPRKGPRQPKCPRKDFFYLHKPKHLAQAQAKGARKKRQWKQLRKHCASTAQALRKLSLRRQGHAKRKHASLFGVSIRRPKKLAAACSPGD
jgi:hypothetical protein